MEKRNITTTTKAQSYIALTRAFQRVQKTLATYENDLECDAWEMQTFNQIDDELTNIIDRLCKVVGTAIIYEND